MLVGCGEAKSLADHNVEVVLNGDTVEFRKIEAEERVGAVVTSIAMSMILDLVRNMVTEQIMAFLGITTTTTPEPCGGLLGEEVITVERSFPITEKALTRASSWLIAATTAFILRIY